MAAEGIGGLEVEVQEDPNHRSHPFCQEDLTFLPLATVGRQGLLVWAMEAVEAMVEVAAVDLAVVAVDGVGPAPVPRGGRGLPAG